MSYNAHRCVVSAPLHAARLRNRNKNTPRLRNLIGALSSSKPRPTTTQLSTTSASPKRCPTTRTGASSAHPMAARLRNRNKNTPGSMSVLLACGWSFNDAHRLRNHNDNNGIRTRIHINDHEKEEHEDADRAAEPPVSAREGTSTFFPTTLQEEHEDPDQREARSCMTRACLHTTSNTRSTTTAAKTSPRPPNTRSTTTTTTKRRQHQEGYNTHNNDETTSTTRSQSHPRYQNQHTDVAPPTISDRPQKPFRGKEER